MLGAALADGTNGCDFYVARRAEVRDRRLPCYSSFIANTWNTLCDRA